MDIRILPSNIANMIAAGEVVQRPASVVKELMENAVDAGADEISVVVTDAGRTLIQVIDNGCGMTPDEAVLCFERHATSKIATAEDLESITTFGFRGEALASIAAVAQVTLTTRREGCELGCRVRMEDSRLVSTEEVAAPKGSNIAVRNLFYNVPARRKFLKSDKVELRHIVDEFTRVALTRPEIAFTLVHDGRELFVLKKVKTLKFRIQDLLGKTAADRIVDLSAKTTVVDVEGFICRPDLARKTVGEQFFFINGRYFRSPYLHKAVMKAYEDMIPDGTTPSYFIWLAADPRSVDVNIHPTKAEVKFEEESVIFNIVYACVREALGKNSFSATIDFDSASGPQMPVFSSRYDEFRPQVGTPAPATDPSYNPFDEMPSGPSWGGRPSDFVDRSEDYGLLMEQKTLPTTSVIVLQGRFILTQVASGVLMVHISRARERILYERFLAALTKGGHCSQTALFPIRIEIGASKCLLLEENAGLLRSLGFEISPGGDGSVTVGAVPEGFACDEKSVSALMDDVIGILSEGGGALPGMMESSMAERFATAGARRGSSPTSPIEAQRLIDVLFGCSNSEFTSRGKRIMTILPTEEIEKKFT